MFSSKDGNEHLNALLKLTELMEDKKLFDKLDGVKSSSEAYDIINKLM
jgi:mannitol/fructose-specific phosphotransferase system IIA component (Ntr-type)